MTYLDMVFAGILHALVKHFVYWNSNSFDKTGLQTRMFRNNVYV
jgi:hypothetical protein